MGGAIGHPRTPEGNWGASRVSWGNCIREQASEKPREAEGLRDKFNVRAVEMEGSGIADATWSEERGYLVVRGTCDYCNPDKGDAWQHYAAIIAAAYTRAVIEMMSSTQ